MNISTLKFVERCLSNILKADIQRGDVYELTLDKPSDYANAQDALLELQEMIHEQERKQPALPSQKAPATAVPERGCYAHKNCRQATRALVRYAIQPGHCFDPVCQGRCLKVISP